MAVLPVLPDVGDVQERRALEADLDERALHAGQHARDAAQVDVADQAARARALDVQLLHDALLEHGDARFLRRYVDEDFMRHGGAGRASLAQPGGAPVAIALRRYSTERPIRARSAAVSASGSPMTPGVAAFDAADERRGAALDRVAARLVERLAGLDVALDLAVRELAQRDAATPTRATSIVVVPAQRDRGEHVVRAARQRARASRAASPASAGLPKITSSSTTSVSAPSTGRGGRPRSCMRCQPTPALVRAMRST